MSGLGAWTWQRLSAVYMVLFLLATAVYLSGHPPHDFAQWHALWAQPVVAIAVALLFLSVLVHAWVGVRDVILDYVRLPHARLLLLALLLGWLLVLAIWLLRVLLGLWL